MTKIKNSEGNGELDVYDTPSSNGFTWVEVRDTRKLAVAGGWFNTAEVLAALNAVDKVDVIAAERAADELQAKLTEAEATIERVRDVMNEFYKVRGDWHSWTGANALKASLESALDPKPAFVLPTEPGVRFEATDNLGHEVTFRAVWVRFEATDNLGHEVTFRAVWNGPHIMYLNESTSVIWHRDNLLAGCTDFRLLGGAE